MRARTFVRRRAAGQRRTHRWVIAAVAPIALAGALVLGGSAASGATLPGVAHYYAAEGNANDAADGAPGTLVGPVSFPGGVNGRAFGLGVGAYVDLPSSVGNFGTGNFTIAFWVNGTPNPGDFTPLLTKRHDSLNFMSINAGTNGVASVEIRSCCSPDNFEGFGGVRPVLDGHWHHLAVVRTGTFLALYVDGTLDRDSTGYTGGVVNLGADPTYASDPLTLGKSLPFPGAYLNGMLDDVQFYNSGLSAAQVQSLMQFAPPGLSVPANVFPVHSGVTVPPGGSVVVTATGLWSIGGEQSLGGPYNANGSTTGYTEDCKLTGPPASESTPMGALVGSFSSVAASSWFRIGVGPTVVTNTGSQPAELLLAGNDSDACVGSGAAFADNSGALSVTITQNAQPAPSFTLVESNTSATITAGQSTVNHISFTPNNGFNGSVTPFIQGPLPPNVTATFNPPSIGNGQTSDLTLSTTAATTPGTYNIQIGGQSGNLFATNPTVGFSLTVSAPQQQNQPPNLTVDNGAIAVDEGTTATNSGTYSDPDGNTVTLSASIGTVTKTGTSSGTWSWSFATDDGPAQTQPVQINANDGKGGNSVRQFQLNVNNVSPTATLNAPTSAETGSTFTVSLTNVFDPSHADVAAGIQASIDCGDGHFFQLGLSRLCTAGPVGTQTVRGMVRDKDNGQNIYSFAVTITPPPAPNPPAFAAELGTHDFVTCLNMQDETAGAQYWFVKAHGTGNLAVDVRAFTVNEAETGTVTASIWDGATQLDTQTVVFPTGAGTQGTENITYLNAAVTNGHIYRVEVTRGAGEAHHYKLSFSNVPVDVGVNSPALPHWFEAGERVFYVNADAGENVNLTLEPGLYGGPFPVSPASSIEFRTTAGTLLSHQDGSGTSPWTASYSSASAQTLKIVVLSNAHYSLDKTSGSDRGIYMGDCPKPPTVSVGTFTVAEGSSITLTANGNDPDGGAVSYAWDLDNNGSFETPGQNVNFTGIDGPADYPIKVRVTDDEGDVAVAESSVHVNNVAPTVTLLGATSVDESPTPVTYTYTALDPAGLNDPLTFTYSCGSAGTLVPGSITANSFKCVFADGPAAGTVSVTANDGDGGTGSASLDVTVQNVAPTVTLLGPTSVDESSAQITYTYTATDPAGPNDPLALTYSCGSAGTLVPGSITANSFKCVFADGLTPAAAGTVSVTATDGDGGTGSASLDVVVRNVAPTVTLLGPTSFDESSAQITYTYTATDPAGPNDPLALTYSCGSAGTLVPGSITANSFKCVFADGPAGGTVSVTANDGDGGTGSASRNVTVRNVAPAITSLTGPVDPIALGNAASVTVAWTDPGVLDTHTVTYNWDDGNVQTVNAVGTGGGSNTTTHTYAASGVYTVTVTVTDKDGASDTRTLSQYIVVFSGTGFVTGGGWINSPAGAYRANLSMTGKATFGFVSKYLPGRQTPDGNTEFQFQAGNLNFHSEQYDFLVVSGYKAQYRGTGTINGVSGYSFLLTAYDGDRPGGDGVDRFRIKIWRTSGGSVVYDNRFGSSDDMDTADPQAIANGSIVIHKS